MPTLSYITFPYVLVLPSLFRRLMCLFTSQCNTFVLIIAFWYIWLSGRDFCLPHSLNGSSCSVFPWLFFSGLFFHVTFHRNLSHFKIKSLCFFYGGFMINLWKFDIFIILRHTIQEQGMSVHLMKFISLFFFFDLKMPLLLKNSYAGYRNSRLICLVFFGTLKMMFHFLITCIFLMRC